MWCVYVCIGMAITHNSKSKNQPGKVANPARGQLNRRHRQGVLDAASLVTQRAAAPNAQAQR